MSIDNDKDVKGAIELTKEQFRDLIAMSRIANDVLGILGDVMPDKKYKELSNRFEALESLLLGLAHDFKSEDLTEKFEGEVIMDQDFYEGFIRKLVDEYDEYAFWDELSTRMGKRDFERTVTKEDKEFMKQEGGWYPERIHQLYEKYRKEFEEHGLERLEINRES